MPEAGTRFRAVDVAIRLFRGRQYKEVRSDCEALLDEVRVSRDDLVFGIVAKTYAVTLMLMGRLNEADEWMRDSLTTFRRFGYELLYTITLSNSGWLRKQMCDYPEAKRILEMAARRFDSSGCAWGTLMVYANLFIVEMRRGDWRSARKYLARADVMRRAVAGNVDPRSDDSEACRGMGVDRPHLDLLTRSFEVAETRLLEIVSDLRKHSRDMQSLALAHEFLGELYTETLRYDEAREHLDTAYQITEKILPESDVMTEVLRRRAQLDCATGNLPSAREAALRCMHLSKQIHDHYEWGAACRVLGDVHVKQDAPRKAQSAYESAIHKLKSIHESYECMRAQIALGRLLVAQEHTDADVYLLEGRQLALKLELDVYRVQADLLLARYAACHGEWDEARGRLLDVERVYDTLQRIDQQIVREELAATRTAIDRAAVEVGLAGAEKLRTMCRVYEDVRFPMEEQQADLAYQVAQMVDAHALYLVQRRGRGYAVPIVYNMARDEAKETVRRFDRRRELPLLGVEDGPRVLTAPGGRMVLAVPAHVDGLGNGAKKNGSRGRRSRNGEAPVLCVEFDVHAPVGPRQFEYLMTGAEALGRLAAERVDPAAKQDGGAGATLPGAKGRGQATRIRESFKEILTVDPEMIRLIHEAERAAGTDVAVLIEGETGVGKELFARAIHAASARHAGPFVAVNVGGMSETLIESELFGHVKGAYTDAVSDREGLVGAASGGTLFLDEIGEMSETLQVKLLRLLESGEYRRLGENTVCGVDLRVVSATNRDLKAEVDREMFRQDVFYRLSAVRLGIPPLRSRRGDVQLLLRHFLREAAVWAGRPDAHYQLDVKAVEALERHAWPGNVRELYNEVLRLVSLIGQDEMIRYAMLSDDVRAAARGERDGGLLEASVDVYERQLILSALDRNDWNRLRTAEAIGVPRTTLLAKMKRLHIATQR